MTSSKTKDIYTSIPSFSTKRFDIRFIRQEDTQSLLNVYPDKNAQVLFNSDNCHGDDFCYESIERMNKAMDFWFESYKNRYFVRYAIVDREAMITVGTVELFTRFSEDHFSNCVIMRMDLLSDYEKCDYIIELTQSFIEHSKEYYDGNLIATKAIDSAQQRIKALLSLGFKKSDCCLIGFDGTRYYDYYEYNL